MTEEEKAIAQCIRKHFPSVAEAEVLKAARHISIGRSIGVGFEQTAKAMKAEVGDLDLLKSAAGDLKRAEEKLRRVGLWGNRYLHGAADPTALDYLELFDGENSDADGSGEDDSVDPREAVIAFAELIASMSKKLLEVSRAAEADVSGTSRPRRPGGRPRRREVQTVVDTLYELFERLAGRPPARLMDRISQQPSGEFHSFVSDMLKALGFEVNPDHYIRETIKEKTRRK
ncbi:MAG: hypothetical protein ACPGID_13140 [Rubricella sp.]